MFRFKKRENEWLELVFEGKNKEYGAYQLRKEDEKTTMKALFLSLLLVTTIGLIFSSFKTKPVIEKSKPELDVDIITPFEFKNKVEKKQKSIPETKKGKAVKDDLSRPLINPIVVNKQLATTTPITENNQLGVIKDPNATEGGTGDGIPNGSSTGIIDTPITPEIDFGGIFNPNSVDKNPNFPGGIDKFIKEVGKKFVAPELEEEKAIRVVVTFVIEKDGTLSNIKVVNDPGFGMGAEAIRVLKNIKTKWEAGFYKGQPVRTTFSLPILVKTGVSE
jgi:periplasmic protein TonB